MFIVENIFHRYGKNVVYSFDLLFDRLNSRVLNSEKIKYLDLLDGITAKVIDHMKYLTKKKSGSTSLLTIWLVADFESSAGRAILQNALEYLVRHFVFLSFFFFNGTSVLNFSFRVFPIVTGWG